MFVRVTCAGVIVGTAEFDPPTGLSHAVLDATAGYACAALFARRMADRLSMSTHWASPSGDFGAAVASEWEGGRLALVDETGRELAVNGIVLVEGLFGESAAVQVVADFRPDLARMSAIIRPNGRTGGLGRTRPAA